MNPTAPTTPTVDKNYFKSPTENIQDYNTRISAYNDSKTKVDAQNAATTAAANPPQTTLAQDQAKTANQGKPGFDVLGNPISTPSSTSTGTPSTSTSTTDPNQQKIQDAQTQDAQKLAESEQLSQTFRDTVSNITNGVTPLNAGEQAQVDALKQQYETAIAQQKLINTGAQGTANIRGYQTGAAEYDPTFQQKTIGSVVAAGAAKILQYQTEESAAVSKLTQALQTNDIANIKMIYDDAQASNQKVRDSIAKTISDTQAAIKSAQEEAKAAQDEADKQQQYRLDVAKFNQTGDQNAFDNAFKVEQEKIAQQNAQATQAQAASNAAETKRHDKATEAVAAFNAGMGAGGGGNNLGISQSAQVGPDGNPDPVSQKQVLDQITAKYGPMTAVSIQSLADYTKNPDDFSTRAAKGGMNRDTAVTLAKMYDPTYSDTKYSTRAGYLTSIASSKPGTTGSAINSANTAVKHLTDFVDTMSKIPNGPSSNVNAFNNRFTAAQNVRTNLSQAQSEANGVVDELAKFFKGTGSTDIPSVETWQKSVNVNGSPADIQGLTQGAIDLLSGQLQTLSEQYTSNMGKAPTSNFLNPTTMAKLSDLKNKGYTIDIPGINYTDKTAWQNNGGTQEQWNSAVDALTKAGLPVTQENILQFAQE